ncbi:hypothetical protein D3C81_1833460 [compost metagenome]
MSYSGAVMITPGLTAASSVSFNATRKRRHAGPPPFCMLCLRSKTLTSLTGPPEPVSDDRYAQTRSLLWHSSGTISSIEPSARDSNWLLNRYERTASSTVTAERGTQIALKLPPRLASLACSWPSIASVSRKASSW